jgi:hypothetical protein
LYQIDSYLLNNSIDGRDSLWIPKMREIGPTPGSR